MKTEEWEPGTGIFLYYCPGCDVDHCFHTKEPNSLGALWTWNNDPNLPTVKPSLDGKGKTESGIIVWRCHHYIENGKIRYLSDSTHHLKGQTVDMVDRK